MIFQGDIEGSIPSASPVAALQGNPVVGELRRLLSEVEGIKATRDELETQLKDIGCDDIGEFHCLCVSVFVFCCLLVLYFS